MQRLCGARTRANGRCRGKAMANGRCRRHGGPNPGGSLPGSRDVGPANRARIARQAVRRALGLKAPWGGRRKRVAPDERARVLQMVDALVEVLPLGPEDKPIEQWTSRELLSDATRKGLIACREIVTWQPDAEDIKTARLIADTGLGLGRLFMRVAEADFRAQANDELGQLLERLATMQAPPAIKRNAARKKKNT
jgi:hypothetical protein